jgi:hypothetical protein
LYFFLEVYIQEQVQSREVQKKNPKKWILLLSCSQYALFCDYMNTCGLVAREWRPFYGSVSKTTGFGRAYSFDEPPLEQRL